MADKSEIKGHKSEVDEEAVGQSAQSDSAKIWAEDDYRFAGQRADENVMMVRTQHPMVMAKTVIFFIVSLVIPYLLVRYAGGGFRSFALGIYTAPALIWVAYNFYGYKNSLAILTNQRILNVLQKGFFNTQVSEAELDRIQDVSSEIKGMLQTVFQFGDVTIRTASNASLLVLRNMAAPYEMQQAIVRALKEAK